MDSALYGRMSLGECIKRSIGNLGCSGDALAHFDNVCSNTRTCENGVSDIAIPIVTTCPEEFKMHLEADYHCHKGTCT